MDERTRQEGELFTRYEARLVTLELNLDDLERVCARYWPIVDKLREAELVADALAIRIREAASFRLTKVHLALGLLALFVPPLVAAITTALLVRGHL